MVGGVPEVVDDVCFPIGCAIDGIGGVEGGFFVGVVGIGLPDCLKSLCCGEEWDRLGEEGFFVLCGFFEEWGNFVIGVVARCHRAGCHDSGFLEDFVLGLPLEETPGFECDQAEAETEDGDEQNVELDQQLQGVAPYFGLASSTVYPGPKWSAGVGNSIEKRVSEGGVFWLALAFKEGKCGQEDAACRDGEEGDGSAVGSLCCRGGGGGVVAALGATLGVGWDGREEGGGECEA